MKQKQTRTYRSETLSLLPLKLVLIDARKGLPPHISRRDSNEELAISLIEKMKMQFTKPGLPVHSLSSHKTRS